VARQAVAREHVRDIAREAFSATATAAVASAAAAVASAAAVARRAAPTITSRDDERAESDQKRDQAQHPTPPASRGSIAVFDAVNEPTGRAMTTQGLRLKRDANATSTPPVR
jgi:hypothetical protein